MDAKKNILLTSAPGTGKTTCIRRVAALLRPGPVAGFYTAEIRERGARTGFELVTFDGKRQVLASTDLKSSRRVSRYGVDVDGFERTVVEMLSRSYPPDTVFIIDEIGKMECMSARFRQAVEALLDGEHRVFATVARKGTGVIDRVKKRTDVTLVELTRENREALPERLAQALTEGAP